MASGSATLGSDSGGSAGITLVGETQFRTIRNLWMLEELGVDYQRIVCMPRSEESYKYNPLGKIPTLVDGDTTVYESAAINTHLAERFRQTSGAVGEAAAALVPPVGTPARARYEQCVSFLQTEVDAQALWIHRKHDALPKVLPGSFPAIPEAVAFAKKQFGAAVHVLCQEMAMAGGQYLLREGFSAADILFVHCLNWATTIEWFPSKDGASNVDLPSGLTAEDVARLQDYLARCRGREAYARAMAGGKLPSAAGGQSHL